MRKIKPPCPMVYHVKDIPQQSFRKPAIFVFIVAWLVLAAGVFIADAILLTGLGYSFLSYTALVTALPAALIAWHEYGKMRRNAPNIGHTFYTLTEGGLLIEHGPQRDAAFICWSHVAWVSRAGKSVHLQLSTGRGISCLLPDQTEERICQFEDFASEHAGTKVPQAALTPPPAEVMRGTPLQFSATAEQRREQADTVELLQHPGIGIRRFVFMLLWAGVFAWAAYEARYLTILLALGMMLWQIRNLNFPGGSTEKLRHTEPRQCYTAAGQLLIVNSLGWSLYRKPQVTALYNLQHGTCICLQDNLPFMIDLGQNIPPHLQAPQQVMPRHPQGNVLYALLAGIVALGAWCFSHSDTWHLHCILEGKGDIKAHTLALLDLPQNTAIESIHAEPLRADTNILYHSGAMPYAAYLQLTTAEGNSRLYFFNQEADLVSPATGEPGEPASDCDTEPAPCPEEI